MSLRSVRREFAESWLRLSRDSTAFLALILLVVDEHLDADHRDAAAEVLDCRCWTSRRRTSSSCWRRSAIAVFLGLRSVEFLADQLQQAGDDQRRLRADGGRR